MAQWHYMTLLQKLAVWQKEQAAKEYLEPYKVLQFAVLKEIARAQPTTNRELLHIKGMGPIKVRKYGDAILRIVRESALVGGGEAPQRVPAAEREEAHGLFAEAQAVNRAAERPSHHLLHHIVDYTTGEVRDDASSDDDIFSVTTLVTMIDTALQAQFRDVRVRGEVVGFKGRNVSGHAYFDIKDEQSVLRCVVFRGAYELSGVELEDGMEIVMTGAPNHHNRYGFSFVGRTVSLAGEGALKKAYDVLKKKLTAEGLLAPEAKRAVPELPQRVGLITSRTGAAIGDFMSNIGQYGYTIRFHHTSVEGANALTELRAALRAMAREHVDVLVVVRGGGSLESLQAFNNETIVRMIRDFPVPVVVGVGHDHDETLATLVADVGVSTPTAAASAVRESWDHAATRVRFAGQQLHMALHNALHRNTRTMAIVTQQLQTQMATIVERVQKVHDQFDTAVAQTSDAMHMTRTSLSSARVILLTTVPQRLHMTTQRIHHYERELAHSYKGIVATMQTLFRRFHTVTDDIHVALTARAIYLRQHTARLFALYREAHRRAHDRITLAPALRSVHDDIHTTHHHIASLHKMIAQHNPERQLALGYSITRNAQGHIVRSVGDVAPQHTITVRVADGDIDATVQ